MQDGVKEKSSLSRKGASLLLDPLQVFAFSRMLIESDERRVEIKICQTNAAYRDNLFLPCVQHSFLV